MTAGDKLRRLVEAEEWRDRTYRKEARIYWDKMWGRLLRMAGGKRIQGQVPPDRVGLPRVFGKTKFAEEYWFDARQDPEFRGYECLIGFARVDSKLPVGQSEGATYRQPPGGPFGGMHTILVVYEGQDWRKGEWTVRGTFFHEFLHFLDWYRTNAGPLHWDEDPDDREAVKRMAALDRLPYREYTSTSHEFNAWYQTAVHDFEEALKDIPPELVKRVHAQFAKGQEGFEYFYQKFREASEFDPADSMTPEGEKRFLKRLYNFYRAVVEEPDRYFEGWV